LFLEVKDTTVSRKVPGAATNVQNYALSARPAGWAMFGLADDVKLVLT
jgi:hypothetical protein